VKAILEFNLPEDSDEYKLITQSRDMYSALFDIREYLRGQYKYDGKDDIEKIYDKFYEILNDNNVSLDV